MVAEKTGNNLITYMFDENGERYGFLYNSTPYYYVRNSQGDVIRILNAAGSIVAKYEYDAWGKVLKVTNAGGAVQTSTTFIGNINPIRYRGYYSDAETGFYYLQSRYYDPETCRFINADEPEMVAMSADTLLAKDLFSYCYNSPMQYRDATGKLPLAFVAVGATVAALFVSTFALSISMYAYAATGSRISNNIDISAWWNPIGNLMKNRLKNSKVVTNRIKEYIKKIPKNKKSYSNTQSISFPTKTTNLKDLDLAMSVGTASNFKMTVTNTGKKQLFTKKTKYNISITLSDRYDFAKFNKADKGTIMT